MFFNWIKGTNFIIQQQSSSIQVVLWTNSHNTNRSSLLVRVHLNHAKQHSMHKHSQKNYDHSLAAPIRCYHKIFVRCIQHRNSLKHWNLLTILCMFAFVSFRVSALVSTVRAFPFPMVHSDLFLSLSSSVCFFIHNWNLTNIVLAFLRIW